MSARSQCVCGDCAEQYGHITQQDAVYTGVWVVTNLTRAQEAAGAYEGDECELDHNHSTSKSCSEHYKCDECGDTYDNTGDADECCPSWSCDFCGSTYSGSGSGWYSSDGKTNAAECCAYTCDDCGAYGWPDFQAGHTCNTGMGMRQILPWEARGIKVDATAPDAGREWKEVWGLEPENLDVVQAAADYYLLEAMKAGLVGTTDGKGTIVLDGLMISTTWRIIMREANDMFDTLVAKWDPILQAYTHMACGGELRHHVAVGGAVLDNDRDRAWNGWKMVFEAVGPDALMDAADLFREFSGGSFGGDPWADACEILHARVTGQLKPALFLDRIFNAQHNGGVLLNKVNWQGEAERYTTGQYKYSINELQSRLLPAHGAEPEPDYPTLLAYASSEVRELFSDCFEFAGHAAKEYGKSLGKRVNKPGVGYTQRGEYNAQLAKSNAKKAAIAAMPKSEQYKLKAAEYDTMIASYVVYARDEAKSNARIDAKVAAGTWKPEGCSCCDISQDPSYYKQTYYTGIVESYKASKQMMLDKAEMYAEAEAKVADGTFNKVPASLEYYPQKVSAAWSDDF